MVLSLTAKFPICVCVCVCGGGGGGGGGKRAFGRNMVMKNPVQWFAVFSNNFAISLECIMKEHLVVCKTCCYDTSSKHLCL